MTRDELVNAYRRMRLIRAFETRLNDLFLQGVVAGTTHLCIGQEACAVGTCAALEPADVVFSNHRGHGHLLARGAEPERVLAEIFGAPHGYAAGRGGSQHMAVREINFLGTHGITAGSIPLAVGAALHKHLRGEPGVAVVFFSDGAVSEGIWHESLNMAAIWHLPVLFVCENNLYAMSSPFSRFSPVPNVADRAAAYGMHSVIADGNDVAAVRDAVAGCRALAEETPQPALIELKTYRQSGHSRSDTCLYRTREEEAEWRARDPLDRARRQLEAEHGWTAADDRQLGDDIAAELATAEDVARQDAGGLHHA